MRIRTFATFLILIGAAFAYGTQANTDWIKFTSPEGRFSLLLPQAPKLEVVTDPTKHNRFSDLSQNSYGFIVEYFDNVTIADPEKYLDQFRDALVSSIHGTLVRERKTTLEGYRGRELELSIITDSGAVVLDQTNIYAVGTSFYSMSYVWNKNVGATLAAKIGEKYFSSIKLTTTK